MSWNVPAWSISTEWWAYLLSLPFFRLLNRGVSARTVLLPLCCAVGLGTLVALHPTHTLNITFDFGLIRCLCDYFIGICLYQFYRDRWQASLLATDQALLGAVFLTGLILHFPLPTKVKFGALEILAPASPWMPLFDAVSPLLFALLILCAAHNTGRGHRLLNAAPLRRLGDISYSVYLMQGVAFLVFFLGSGIWSQQHPQQPLPPVLMLGLTVGTLGADLLMATVTYRRVEVPARRWLRRKMIAGSPSSVFENGLQQESRIARGE